MPQKSLLVEELKTPCTIQRRLAGVDNDRWATVGRTFASIKSNNASQTRTETEEGQAAPIIRKKGIVRAGTDIDVGDQLFDGKWIYYVEGICEDDTDRNLIRLDLVMRLDEMRRLTADSSKLLLSPYLDVNEFAGVFVSWMDVRRKITFAATGDAPAWMPSAAPNSRPAILLESEEGLVATSTALSGLRFSEGTICLIAKITPPATELAVPILSASANGTTSFRIYSRSDGKLQFLVTDDTGSGPVTLADVTTADNFGDAWQSIVVRYKAGSAEIRINGIVAGSGDYTIPSSSTTPLTVTLGLSLSPIDEAARMQLGFVVWWDEWKETLGSLGKVTRDVWGIG